MTARAPSEDVPEEEAHSNGNAATPGESSKPANASATPLPWSKLGILIGMRFAEPISFTVIFPFINAMVYDLGATKDKGKVGFYAGLIESLFALTQCCTVLYWGTLSDRIGRKPVLLLGLFGVACSALLFGLSRTFLWAVLARALAGALNGNVAVVKSVVGELTDRTNEAQAFSFLPLTWATGCTVGPALGGYLSRPAEQYPKLFASPDGILAFNGFWDDYPYFLPCAVSALLTLMSFILGFFFLDETLPSKVEARKEREAREQAQQATEARAEAEELLLNGHSTSYGSIPDERFATLPRSGLPADQARRLGSYAHEKRGRQRALIGQTFSWTGGFTPTASRAASPSPSTERNSRAASTFGDNGAPRTARPENGENGEARATREAAGEARESSQDNAKGEQKGSGVLYLLRSLHIQRILLSYAFLSLCAVAIDSVLVLYLYEPISLGGLDFNSQQTGAVLSASGAGSVLVQLVLFPFLQRRIGTLRLYQLSMCTLPLVALILPISNVVARAGLRHDADEGPDDEGNMSKNLPAQTQALVWIIVSIAMLFKTIGSMAFSCNIILVNQCSVLAKGAQLGTLNGLAQMSASLMRAIGPYGASTVFALSVTHHLLGGNLVWAILAAIGTLGAISCLGITNIERKLATGELSKDPAPPADRR